MELSSSDKERIQHQYDALAKKTLVGEAKSHRRTLAKRAAREYCSGPRPLDSCYRPSALYGISQLRWIDALD